MDEEITMKKSELQALIKEGINKHLARNAPGKVITQRNVFNDLSEELTAKIVDFNFRNDIEKYAYRKTPDAMWGTKGAMVLTSNLHEHIRKATLCLMGVRKNEDLLFSELDMTRNIYKKLADLSFNEYQERVLNEKKPTAATEG